MEPTEPKTEGVAPNEASDPSPSEPSRPRHATDIFRRVLSSGAGALFSSEEGIRKMAADLPKEAANFFVAQAQHTKDEVARVLANELRRFLNNVDLQEVARRVLTNLTLEVKTEIRFLPKDAKDKADTKSKVTLKRRSTDG